LQLESARLPNLQICGELEGPPVQKSDLIRMKINWNDLRYILALGRNGSLSGAARSLAVNETTVARRIAAVEETLGVQLFDKVQIGKLPPTRAGEIVVTHAELIERQVIDLSNQVAGGDAAVAGNVRLTAVPILANRVLVPASGGLLDRYPQLRVEIVADFRDLSLTKREADIALRLAAPNKGTGNAVLTRKISVLEYGVYAAAALDADAALRLPWITYEPAMGHIPQARWIRDEIEKSARPVAAISVNDAEGSLRAVQAGLGRSLLPCIVASSVPGLRRIPGARGEEPYFRELWVLTHPEQRSLGRIDAVIAWLELIFR
jgi:DNA-binding transcriptional LysR family regulator